MDKNICLRLGHTINIFHELLQTALPPGPCTESLIKTVNRLYAVLTNLVKMASLVLLFIKLSITDGVLPTMQ